MMLLAKAMTDAEIRTAAEYFGAMKWTPWTRVVETDLVPKTRIEGNLFLTLSSARTEPIADESSRRLRIKNSPRSYGIRGPALLPTCPSAASSGESIW